MGYSPWGDKESDTTEWLTLSPGILDQVKKQVPLEKTPLFASQTPRAASPPLQGSGDFPSTNHRRIDSENLFFRMAYPGPQGIFSSQRVKSSPAGSISTFPGLSCRCQRRSSTEQTLIGVKDTHSLGAGLSSLVSAMWLGSASIPDACLVPGSGSSLGVNEIGPSPGGPHSPEGELDK